MPNRFVLSKSIKEIKMNISMKKSRHSCMVLFLAISVIFLITSCSPPNEKAHPAYNKAENEMKNNNYTTAADCYQEYLCFNRRSAITHYKLGKLYGDYLDNPFLSAYHFREYLKYEPQSPDKDAIDAWVVAADKKSAKKIQEQYPDDFASQTDYITMKENQEKLIKYILKLKKQNAELLKKQRGEMTVESGKGRETLVKAEGIKEIYTVQPGDNLQRISRNVYGTSKHYKLIFEANRNILKTESELKIGQKLQIPKLKNISAKSVPVKPKEETIENTEVILDYPSE